MNATPTIAILGASGLIGHTLAIELQRLGCSVIPIARSFTAAQRADYRHDPRKIGVVDLPVGDLAALLASTGADVVINCVGVLQNAPGVATEDVHAGFVARLLAALGDRLLVQVSIPALGSDTTDFARTKREAEAVIAASGKSCVIVRPGFAIADAAFGGSALLRALAMWPVALPHTLGSRPLAVTSVADLAAGLVQIIAGWRRGERLPARPLHAFSDPDATTASVLAAFRRRLGGPPPRLVLPAALLAVGARLCDAVATLGWRPPVRSTALAEMQRGVGGDATDWYAATATFPRSVASIVEDVPATLAERWFARLYLLKAVIVVALVKFWVVSGLIALLPSFAAARDILVSHGVAPAPASLVTYVSCGLDISVGLLIAVHRTHRLGLALGMLVSLGYMLGAAVLTPDLWLEPLGALVKTGPAVILMLVALVISDNR